MTPPAPHRAAPNPLMERARAVPASSAAALVRAAAPVLVALLIGLVLHFGVAPRLPEFFPRVILDIGINVILAVSLTMVNGFTGQFSMGHAAFMAVGAYTAATIVYYGSARLLGTQDFAAARVHAGLLSTMLQGRDAPLLTAGDGVFVIALLAGGLAAALCGYLVGLPSLRLKGDYLAIVTLGFGEIVRVIIQSQTTDTLYDVEQIRATPWFHLLRYMGGPVGFTGLPSYTSLFWVWSITVITLVVAFRLKVSTFGRAFLSIREDEIAAEAMGVRTTTYKVRAFVIAAFFAGVAGGLYAHTIGIQLNAGELAFMKSFDIIIMVVLGGMGSISGAAIAAAILTILPEALRKPPPVDQPWFLLVLAAAWAAAIMLAPRARWWLVGITAAGAAYAWWVRDSLASPPMFILVAGSGVLVLLFARRRATAMAWLAAAVAAYIAVRAAAAEAGINLADYRMVLYALALILMMILRPQGLFGVRELWNAWRVHPLRPRHARAEGGKSGTAGGVPVQ